MSDRAEREEECEAAGGAGGEAVASKRAEGFSWKDYNLYILLFLIHRSKISKIFNVRGFNGLVG